MLMFSFGFVCGVLAVIVLSVVWHLVSQRRKDADFTRTVSDAEASALTAAIAALDELRDDYRLLIVGKAKKTEVRDAMRDKVQVAMDNARACGAILLPDTAEQLFNEIDLAPLPQGWSALDVAMSRRKDVH